jgi:acyl carrier protein
MDSTQILKDEILKRLDITVTDEDINAGISLKDKGIDSLDSIELLVSIEDIMGCEFSDDELDKLDNLRDLADYLRTFE